jgi:hypothetical protein
LIIPNKYTRRLQTLIKVFLLVAVSLILSLLVAEIVAGWVVADPRQAVAHKNGVEYDDRNRLQVILDCRKTTYNCFPSVPPNTFIENRLRVGESMLLPLSGVANATVIGCNESGYYSTYKTDKFGFRNPPGSWPDSVPIDLAFVGDSYTVGDCVNEGDHIADMLRGSFAHVVNLAYGGNGPLFELAAIREYLADSDVRYVFWVYFERNDLSDLERDKNIDTLSDYLEPGFTQKLASRQREIDAATREYLDDRINEKINGRAVLFPNLRLLLWRIRYTKTGTVNKIDNTAYYDLSMFRKILATAKQLVEKNGGQLVFVYLPEYERFNHEVPSAPWSGAGMKTEVLAMVASLGIGLIDIEPAFLAVADPLNLFPFRMQGHYNKQGYSIVANEIHKHLSAEGN